MPIKIFISHAAADESLASALVDCLLSSMILEDEDVRCTSVPGHKLPVGSDFAQFLLEDITNSTVVIGLITTNALSSSWVLFELGATWGARKALQPLVTDRIDLKALPGALSGRNVARLSRRTDLTQFLEELTTAIAAKARSRAKVEKAVENLMAAHAKHLASTPTSAMKPSVKSEPKEPVIAGLPFSELAAMLKKEQITIPAKHFGGESDAEQSLLTMFVNNAKQIANGIQSNYDAGTSGAFM